LESGDGARADLVTLMLMLCQGGEHVHHELVGMGIIDRNELHPTFHETRNEGDVAGEAIELGNHQDGATTPAQIKRGDELRPVILPAASNLGELCFQIAPALEVAGDDRALRFEAKAEAALPLASGGHAIIGDKGRYNPFLFSPKRGGKLPACFCRASQRKGP